MHVAFEVIKIVGFLPPASLTLGFADTAALGLGAVALALDIAVIGMKETFTVQTFTLSSGVCHRPGSPWAYDAKMALGKEENRQYKWHEEEEGKRGKKIEERDGYQILEKKTEWPNLQFQPGRSIAVYGRR
jgi:hypothetical protein